MASGNAVDYKWYRYVDDNGANWSIRTDKSWGDAGGSGMAAHNAADPVFPRSHFYRTRKAVLQDAVSGRTTKRVLGASGAAAGVPGATVTTVARGAGGTYTLTSLGTISERLPHHGTIISKAEPVTT